MKTQNQSSKETKRLNNLQLLALALATLSGLLRQKVCYDVSMYLLFARACKPTLVNVGEDTALGNGNMAQELVQLLVVANSELEMTGDDTCLLVVPGSVASKLEYLSSKVLENCGEVDGRASTDTLGVISLTEETVNTADREGQASLG